MNPVAYLRAGLLAAILALPAFAALAAQTPAPRTSSTAFEATYQGTRYALVGPTSWSSGFARAQEMGGRLPVITSEAETEWFWNTFKPRIASNGSFWLGLSRRTVADPWYWVNGAPVEWSNWGLSEPNNWRPDMPELVVHLYYEPSSQMLRWNDTNETRGYPFRPVYTVVQFPSPERLAQETRDAERRSQQPGVTYRDRVPMSLSESAWQGPGISAFRWGVVVFAILAVSYALWAASRARKRDEQSLNRRKSEPTLPSDN